MNHTAATCPNPGHCIDAQCYAERTARYQVAPVDALETERAKGAKCYWDGGSRLHGNPHADGTPEFSAWAQGWNAAQAERWERDCPTAAMLLKSRAATPNPTA